MDIIRPLRPSRLVNRDTRLFAEDGRHRKVAMQLITIWVGAILSAATLSSALAFQDLPCESEGKRVLADVADRWEWESFWDGGTSGFQYMPKTRSTAIAFWNSDLGGICSAELGACTAYERSGAQLGEFLRAKMFSAGVRSREAETTLLAELGEPRILAGPAPASDGRESGVGRFAGGGAVFVIPAPSQEVAVRRNVAGVQSCVLQNNRFPPLRLPRSVRNKIKPDGVLELELWLKGRLHPPSGKTIEYIIPYYAPSDPVVYVLVRVGGITESVVLVVRSPAGGGWQIGGHLDPNESPDRMRRVEGLILSARMVSVAP
jgi:hypothetical protein